MKSLTDSLTATADTDQWELHVGVDPDDLRRDAHQVLHHVLPPAIYFSPDGHDGKPLIRCTWAINWLARFAADATHLWALNDDVTVQAQGWDRRILTLEPGQLGLSDYSPSAGWHSNFPVFTAAHHREFRTLFHPRFWGWGADHWICRTYALAGRAKRLFIDLEHAQADQQRQQKIQRFGPAPPTPTEMLIWAQRIKALAQKKDPHDE